jgi:hypothetical protein
MGMIAPERQRRKLVRTYRVNVVANYPESADLTGLVALGRLPKKPCDTPQLDTTAIALTSSHHTSATPPLQTITIVYEAEGQNPAQATAFAAAIFEHERRNWGLATPETVFSSLAEQGY